MPVTVSAPKADDSLGDGDRLELTPSSSEAVAQAVRKGDSLSDSRPKRDVAGRVFVGRLALMNRIDRALKRRANETSEIPAHESGSGSLPQPPPTEELY